MEFNIEGKTLQKVILTKDDKKVVIPEGVSIIAPYAFFNLENLEEVIVPNTVREIKYKAFSLCKNLKKINLPDSLTKIFNFAIGNSGERLAFLEK